MLGAGAGSQRRTRSPLPPDVEPGSFVSAAASSLGLSGAWTGARRVPTYSLVLRRVEPVSQDGLPRTRGPVAALSRPPALPSLGSPSLDQLTPEPGLRSPVGPRCAPELSSAPPLRPSEPRNSVSETRVSAHPFSLVDGDAVSAPQMRSTAVLKFPECLPLSPLPVRVQGLPVTRASAPAFPFSRPRHSPFSQLRLISSRNQGPCLQRMPQLPSRKTEPCIVS